jgi:hypothetical protein
VFEIIKGVIGLVAGIDFIQNVLEHLFGQVGKGFGIFKLLSSESSHCELCLKEVERDCWLLLVAGTKFQMGSYDCRYEFLTDLLSPRGR